MAREYRVLIAPRGDTSVTEATADLVLGLDHLAEPPVPGGQAVRPLSGSTVESPYTLPTIDADGDITGLWGTDARANLLGRLILAQERDDGGAWEDIDAGRISGASEQEPGRWLLEVSSERWAERRGRIFETTDTAQLWPLGISEDFSRGLTKVEAAGRASAEVGAVDGDFVRLDPITPSDRSVPTGIGEIVRDDLVTDPLVGSQATDGNFRTLRLEHGSDTYRIVALGGGDNLEETHDPLGTVNPDRSHPTFTGCWVYWPSHGYTGNETVTDLRIRWSEGVPVSEVVPRHIGGGTGKALFQLVKEIYDGDYGGQPVRYDTTAMDALIAGDYPKVWVRATQGAERAKWLEQNVFGPWQVAPLRGADGKIRLVSLRIDTDVDPDTLPILDRDTVEGHQWENLGREVVTQVTLTSRRLKRDIQETGTTTGAPAIDGLTAYDRTETPGAHDTDGTLGVRVHAYRTELVLPAFRERNEANVAAHEVYDLYGDGPILRRLTADAVELDLSEGDLVRIDCESLAVPNPATSARTGIRLARVLEARIGPASAELVLLDFGPAGQPLTAPTVSIAQDATDDDVMEVTVSGLGSGERAIVELTHAETSTQPDDDDWTIVEEGVANGTQTFRLRASGGHAHVRAQARAPGRIRSAWVYDSTALSTRAIVAEAEVALSDGTATVTGEANADTLGIRVHYAVHDPETEPTLSTSEDFDAANLGSGLELAASVAPGQQITAEVEGWTGFSSGAVSGTAGPRVRTSATREQDRAILPDLLVKSVTIATASLHATADVVVEVSDPEGASGTLDIWSNPSSTSDPDPSGAADESLTVSAGQTAGPSGSADVTAASLTGVRVALLTRPGNRKMVYVRWTSEDGRSTGVRGIPLTRGLLELQEVDSSRFAGNLPRRIRTAVGEAETGDVLADADQLASALRDGLGRFVVDMFDKDSDDFDDVPEGATYSKVRGTVLSDGRVRFIRRSGGTDHDADDLFDRTAETLDDVGDGATYGKVRGGGLSDGRVRIIRRSAGDDVDADDVFDRSRETADDVPVGTLYTLPAIGYFDGSRRPNLLRADTGAFDVNPDDLLDGATQFKAAVEVTRGAGGTVSLGNVGNRVGVAGQIYTIASGGPNLQASDDDSDGFYDVDWDAFTVRVGGENVSVAASSDGPFAEGAELWFYVDGDGTAALTASHASALDHDRIIVSSITIPTGSGGSGSGDGNITPI